MQKNHLSVLVNAALLIAIEVVLARFCSISTPIVRIGFGFVPIAVCGMLYGPVWGMAAGGLADFIGAIVFPFSGTYFPGFTLSAALTGLVFGILLYRRETSTKAICIAVAINCLLISLGLNTFWLTILTKTPYFVLLPTRLVQCGIMIAVQIAVLRLLARPVVVYARKKHA